MMIQNPEDSQQLVTVNQSDVDRMLDCYDSGMFDASTSNAIALAVNRLLKPGYRVRLFRNPTSHECSVRIDEFQSEIPKELFEWLEKAERASPVEDISFRMTLPKDRLAKPVKTVQSPSRSEQVSLVA